MIPSTPPLAAVETAPPDDVNVLVVDDVPQNLVAMRALIARPGIRVLTAKSGAEALELLLLHEVALALLDVQMPDMDGFTLAELMRGAERTSAVPIIFMTAAALEHQPSFRGYEAGAVDFLTKPVDQHVLLSKVAVFVELYEQRRRLRDHVDEMQRVLLFNEAMVAVLTHDLRTPLSAILASAELVRRKATDDTLRGAAERIKESGLRMSRMVAQLLDYSRIRSGSLQLDKTAGDLAELASAAVAELRQAQPQAMIELQVAGDTRGVFDADRLSQVASNLISNAVQHGRAGAPIEVRVDGNAPDELRVRIANAGSLPEEVRQRLFEPFRSSRSGSAGLGLGLYIVAQFVQAHGGAVRAEVVGADTTVFEFSLPRG